MDWTSFEVAFSLFLIMDPIGNAPVTLALLKDLPSDKQVKVVIRELFFALVIMVLFEFLGDALLTLLKIEHSTLRISGGIILFIIALKMVFPEEKRRLMDFDKDPFFVPIAVPFFAGPSLLTAIIIYSHRYKPVIVLVSILIAWISSVVVMLLAFRFRHLLKNRIGRAAERLMGLILIFISIQMLEDGIRMFLKGLKQ